MTRLLVTLAALVALGAAAPARGAEPQPWCGTSSSAVDRLPDATPGYAIHVAYVRAPGAPDRFAQLAPRFVDDAAAVEAWWRAQDPTRSPRFDLFPAQACASTFGALDITSVELRQETGGIESAFRRIRLQLASDVGFGEPEKVYLVYYDGATGQSGDERVCGQGARGGSFGLPATAVVYLDSCDADTDDALRPVVAVHELLHVLGAVASAAPNDCAGDLRGHVCDSELDLMTPGLSAAGLAALVLDAGRDDYYAHSGAWIDVQDALFLERLDSADRTPPSLPEELRVGDGATGLVRVSWLPAQDDVGPVSYRVYRDGRFVEEVAGTSVVLPATAATALYSVRAADPVGHLGPVADARFRPRVGMVDERGRLVRDTARPPGVAGVRVRRTGNGVVVTWAPVRDAGGLRGYLVRIGTRTLAVRKPAIALFRPRVTGAVSIAAVDRAGNVGPALVVARARLR